MTAIKLIKKRLLPFCCQVSDTHISFDYSQPSFSSFSILINLFSTMFPSSFGGMPLELHHCLVEYLDIQDLISLSHTCQLFHFIYGKASWRKTLIYPDNYLFQVPVPLREAYRPIPDKLFLSEPAWIYSESIQCLTIFERSERIFELLGLLAGEKYVGVNEIGLYEPVPYDEYELFELKLLAAKNINPQIQLSMLRFTQVVDVDYIPLAKFFGLDLVDQNRLLSRIVPQKPHVFSDLHFLVHWDEVGLVNNTNVPDLIFPCYKDRGWSGMKRLHLSYNLSRLGPPTIDLRNLDLLTEFKLEIEYSDLQFLRCPQSKSLNNMPSSLREYNIVFHRVNEQLKDVSSDLKSFDRPWSLHYVTEIENRTDKPFEHACFDWATLFEIVSFPNLSKITAFSCLDLGQASIPLFSGPNLQFCVQQLVELEIRFGSINEHHFLFECFLPQLCQFVSLEGLELHIGFLNENPGTTLEMNVASWCILERDESRIIHNDWLNILTKMNPLLRNFMEFTFALPKEEYALLVDYSKEVFDNLVVRFDQFNLSSVDMNRELGYFMFEMLISAVGKIKTLKRFKSHFKALQWKSLQLSKLLREHPNLQKAQIFLTLPCFDPNVDNSFPITAVENCLENIKDINHNVVPEWSRESRRCRVLMDFHVLQYKRNLLIQQ